MHVDSLWRHPVKSMAGERLGHADLGDRGVPGTVSSTWWTQAAALVRDAAGAGARLVAAEGPDIRMRFDGTLALNAWTAQPGRVRVGDPVAATELDDVPAGRRRTVACTKPRGWPAPRR